MKKLFTQPYEHIISIENLLEAWKAFVIGKKHRKDVQIFERNLMANVIMLHRDLISKTYQHSAYQAFKISDPKPRYIHKASVRDRLLHHALHRVLSPFFIKTFISDSYSCQIGKGTHRALKRFRQFSKIVSKNDTRTAWVLKCDIKKFFANIDQTTLLTIIGKYIRDKEIIRLTSKIVGSFNSGINGVGLPLGNLTSQLLVNIYMNEFDQWMKHVIKAKYYIRYTDDFVILSSDKEHLSELIPKIDDFLKEKLKLHLHPDKVFIKTLASGIDFLGWVHFSDHRVLRTTTKRRMLKRMMNNPKLQTIQSYLGMLSWGNTKKLRQKIEYSLVPPRYRIMT
jgi:retron-type reverse transcriptase